MSDNELPEDLLRDLESFDRRMREEIREEAREEEALMAETELREQTFAQSLLELVNRGDTVQVITPSRVFTGQLIYAGRDFVTLKDTESFVDISLLQPCAVHIVERVKSGGRAKGEGPAAFEMRLYEHKMEFAEVEVYVSAVPDGIRGKIDIVGHDHIRLTAANKESWLFPLSSVRFVVRRIGTIR